MAATHTKFTFTTEEQLIKAVKAHRMTDNWGAMLTAVYRFVTRHHLTPPTRRALRFKMGFLAGCAGKLGAKARGIIREMDNGREGHT